MINNDKDSESEDEEILLKNREELLVKSKNDIKMKLLDSKCDYDYVMDLLENHENALSNLDENLKRLDNTNHNKRILIMQELLQVRERDECEKDIIDKLRDIKTTYYRSYKGDNLLHELEDTQEDVLIRSNEAKQLSQQIPLIKELVNISEELSALCKAGLLEKREELMKLITELTDYEVPTIHNLVKNKQFVGLLQREVQWLNDHHRVGECTRSNESNCISSYSGDTEYDRTTSLNESIISLFS